MYECLKREGLLRYWSTYLKLHSSFVKWLHDRWCQLQFKIIVNILQTFIFILHIAICLKHLEREAWSRFLFTIEILISVALLYCDSYTSFERRITKKRAMTWFDVMHSTQCTLHNGYIDICMYTYMIDEYMGIYVSDSEIIHGWIRNIIY